MDTLLFPISGLLRCAHALTCSSALRCSSSVFRTGVVYRCWGCACTVQSSSMRQIFCISVQACERGNFAALRMNGALLKCQIWGSGSAHGVLPKQQCLNRPTQLKCTVLGMGLVVIRQNPTFHMKMMKPRGEGFQRPSVPLRTA